MVDTFSVLVASQLSDDELRLLQQHLEQLGAKQFRNRRRNNYYDGKARIRQLGIALPPQMQSIETVVGWPATVVDGLEERLDIEGFTLPDGTSTSDLGLDEVWDHNDMPAASSEAHTDAMIYGVEFVAVTNGDEATDEPHPLITVEPPTRMTGTYDPRRRRLSSATSIVWDDQKHRAVAATLHTETESIFLQARPDGRWWVTDRDEHGLGHPPVVRIVNKPRRGRPWGKSEISRAVISLTDTAVRTLLGMEVAREFYSAPQRWIMGADESAFVGPDGQPKTAWESYLGRVLALSRDEDGEIPEVGQFSASSPEPYIAQVRMLAVLLAAEAAMPSAYFGFQTDNPSSADAIRALEARLVKRAERRQKSYGAAWAEVTRIALRRLNGGTLPDGADRLEVLWRDAATPTRSAQAASVSQLVTAGVLPPTAEVTYEKLGFSRTDIERLMADQRRQRASQLVAGLRSAAGQLPTGDQPPALEVTERAAIAAAGS